MNSPVISCRNLGFSYAGRPVLKGVDLDFYPGEFVALLGCNGAGKSTLLSCLCGLKAARFDRLTLDGMDLARTGRREVARRLSFVPQEHDEMFAFTVLEVVVMGRTAFLGSFGAPSQQDEHMAEQVLDELQIRHLARRIYTGLSGGEKQLVLLARALVQTRHVVFLDEPTNHLDYSNRYQMLSQLRELSCNDGSCVVACLHDPNHALLFSDRVILLDQGRVLADGPTRQVLSGRAVSQLYGIAAWQEEGGGVGSIFPAFVHPAFKGRVLLVVGSSGEGKTSLLEKTVDTRKDISFGGILCPGTFKHHLRYSIQVRNLGTGETAAFARRADETGQGPFEFFKEGQTLAQAALDPLLNLDRNCVVVDEVGPLELKGEGLAPLLAPLLSIEGTRHIWAVRPKIVDRVCRRWMLADPVIVRATDPCALERINEFLNEK